ncbi:MAG: leucine-rich repeat domain-containing protein [Bacteroidales bacterium]|nr:leucine-rich repeat domain-containing protein [Bacteroidales bacterium]
MKLQFLKTFALAATFALALAPQGKSETLPVPDDCRIIDDICYKFDASNKTALVSTYKTFSAEPWSRQDRYYTYNMTNLVIPATIDIDSQEYTVVGFDNPFFYGSSPDTVVIPPTIVAITNVGLSNTKAIQLHNGIKEIGYRVFRGNNWLTEIELPDGLETIGDEAFEYSSLESIHLPGSVKNLGLRIFANCEFLKEIVLEEGIPEIPAGMFYRDPVTSISLPKTVTKIGAQAFEECPLQSIEFPESLCEIGRWAFMGTSLSSIQFKEGLETIGYGAFSDLKGESLIINLPYNLKVIGQEAFKDSPVKEVMIQKNVESIGMDAFAGCPIEKVISQIEQPRYTPLPFQAFDDNVFLYQPLYVPTGLVDEYRRVIYWNKFYDIFEMDMSPLESVTIDNGTPRYYTIDGKELAAPQKGLYIIQKDGKSQKILKK